MSSGMEVLPDAQALAERAADLIIETAAEAIARRGQFTLVLAGGSTPEKTYTLLAQPERAARVDWSQTWIIMGDERLVPSNDPRSNLGMVRRSLLNHVPIPAEQILAVPTDRATSAASAASFARLLASAFHLDPDGPPPQFDLILLGLGDDGHTASLFPQAEALREERAWAVASPPGVLPPPVDRVTLTFPVLNAARRVAFLVAGANKAPALQAARDPATDPQLYPAAGVRPSEGELLWLVDRAASG
jgi:6-phosphogluconolactonase